MNNLLNAANLPILLLAGSATLTFESKRTGQYFTYTVKLRPKAHNEDPDEYIVISKTVTIGVLEGMQFIYKPAVLVGSESNDQLMFAWIWKHLIKAAHIDNYVNIYHVGKCVRCGRQLTTPESVLTGIGPECLKAIEKGYTF